MEFRVFANLTAFKSICKHVEGAHLTSVWGMHYEWLQIYTRPPVVHYSRLQAKGMGEVQLHFSSFWKNTLCWQTKALCHEHEQTTPPKSPGHLTLLDEKTTSNLKRTKDNINFWLCLEIKAIILQGFSVLIWGGHVLMALTRATWYFVSPELEDFLMLILHLSTNTSLCTVGRGDNMPLWCITTTHGADCKETISARRAGNYILNPFIVLIHPSWRL